MFYRGWARGLGATAAAGAGLATAMYQSRPALAAPLQPNSSLGDNLPTLQLKKVSYFAARGPRSTMEDRMFFSPDNRFFAVYDGHGGHSVAELARKYLYLEFLTDLIKLTEEGAALPETERVMRAFHSSFTTFSDHVISNPSLDYEGSTAIVVYLTDTAIVTANLGDSRAILCRSSKAIDLSIDHKPNYPPERKRIEALGGTVRWHGFTGPDRMPVPGMGAYRMNNNLSLSRAFGDHLEMPFVTAEPEVAMVSRKPALDRFIVLASDGLWDVMTSQEVVDFVRQIMAKSSLGQEVQSDSTGGNEGWGKKEKSELEVQHDRRMEKMAKVGLAFSTRTSLTR
ncbi:hypothetical protein BASA81_000497 [Batrachochytrium salamandrivorans]|nr:hypothetical protein BASA81_000497 [Batrachochytrium salamandrivorans]